MCRSADRRPRLAVAALLLGPAAASTHAQIDRALAIDPTLRDARELLGRVLYRTGDLNGAILVLDGLVGESRGGGEPKPALVDTLDRWRREADLRDRMHLTVGSGFTVAFEGPEDAALAARALASIEQASARIGSLLSHYPTRPIPVVLYTNEQFRDVTSPAWAGGAFDGTIRRRQRLCRDAAAPRPVGEGVDFDAAFDRRMPRSVSDFEASFDRP